MLRLWPETIPVCLFPGIAWICRKGVDAMPILSEPTRDATALLDQLRALLDGQETPLPAGSRLVLTVSDTLANIVALPWQQTLHRAAEIDTYARACFEHADLALDEGWTMHAEFRNLDAMGLAYALPTAWLSALLEELAQRKLVLAAVLPVSAAIYFGVGPRRGTWPAVMIAREHYRYTACVFGAAGLMAYDAEAIIGNSESSIHRLEGRIAARYGSVLRKADWHADDPAKSLGGAAWSTMP